MSTVWGRWSGAIGRKIFNFRLNHSVVKVSLSACQKKFSLKMTNMQTMVADGSALSEVELFNWP